MTRRWTVLALAVVTAAAVAVAAFAGVGERDRILAAADSEHLWWIESTAKETVLIHGSTAGDRLVRGPLATYVDPPEALTALGERAWLVFPPAAGRSNDRREVITLKVVRNPATGIFYSVPTSGADLLPSLPAHGDLVGFEADAAGVWALILPPPATRYGVRRDGASSGGDPAGPVLWRLSGPEWETTRLPDAIAAEPVMSLARLGDSIVVVTPDRSGSLLATPDGDQWRLRVVETPFASSRYFTAAGRPAVATVDDQDLRFAYLRDGLAVPWAVMATPTPPFGIVGDAHGGLVVGHRDAALVGWRIDPLATLARPAAPFGEVPTSTGTWMHLPVVGMLVLATLLAFFFLRELATRGTAEEEPAPAVPALPLERRLIALLIDLVPAAIAAHFLTDAGLFDLLRLPTLSVDRSEAGGSMAMILLCCAHSAIGEGLTGRSLGKWLMGGIVLRPDGSPVAWWSVIVRNLFKVLVLAAPILGVVALLSVGHRGVQDVIARTFVSDTRPRTPQSD